MIKKRPLRNLLIYTSLVLLGSAGLKSFVDLRGKLIMREYATFLSSDKTRELFEQTRQEYGLEDENIELIFGETSSNTAGLTEKTDAGYRVTLNKPYSDVVVRHELSHVDDLASNRFYLNSMPNLISWAASEIRAQDRSIP